MERKQIPSCSSYDRLPPLLTANYPWLVAQNLEAEDDGEQIFYTVQDPMSHYRCRIPELLGKRIRGCFHGWVTLSNHPHGDKWSLWNPVASKCIFLPRLIMKDGDSNDIVDCCLPSPPDDPGSIILLIRKTKPNFVFCRLDRKRKRLRWTEMSYSRQLWNIFGVENDFLVSLTCCNGKVYSLIGKSARIVHVQIVVKDKEVVISLSPFVRVPNFYAAGSQWDIFLKGSSQELFAIMLGFTDLTKEKPVDVSLYKLDVTSMVWTEMKELKGMVFFVDMMNQDMLATSAIASEFGGYIHIFHKTGKVIYSYDVKDKSISMSYMHSLDLPPSSRSWGLRTSHISVWTIPGFRMLQGDHGEAKCKAHPKQDEMVVRSVTNDEVEFSYTTDESWLLDIPFHVLEMIIEFCVGVEYLNFRATCKRCHLAAPVIKWSNEERLQTYSLSSPWMMRFEKDEGIIAFTDPMFGDKYFITAYSEELFHEKRILCSRYGWLLLFIDVQLLVFFNPFTDDMLELPDVLHLQCFSFSAPPTSPGCTVVGFLTERFIEDTTIYLHSVGGEASWRRVHLDLHSVFFMFPTFCDRDVYVLSNKGGLHVFKDDDSSFETVVAEPPRSCRSLTEYFLVKCDQHVLLLVVVEDFGESVEVFKLKDDSSTKEWEKMDDLGRHVIYICGTMCLCMDAKTPEMENKIFFPLLHLKNEKMVFYSLETRRYHTFNGSNGNEDLRDVFETKHKFSAHAWIEPSWASLAKLD